MLNKSESSADSIAIKSALSGNTGAAIINNYLDKSVLSAWVPIKIGTHQWALLAEIDVVEALSPEDEAGAAFYSEYAKRYGYPDLYLINKDGYVFYSVSQGADMGTNLLTGKYSSSSLGVLVKDVKEKQAFGFSDFAKYAADSDKAAAFMAMPLVTGEKKLELIIVLKLPIEGINSITSIREGMGDTGESYLVGPDFLMRSDSYIDPENRSVAASFAGNIENNGIDTLAVQEALAGNSDAKIITNALGKKVLSAYSPIDVGGVTWALMAEIDEEEAFNAAQNLKWLTLVILLVSIVLIVIFGVIMASRISKPLVNASLLAEQVASGRFIIKY